MHQALFCYYFLLPSIKTINFIPGYQENSLVRLAEDADILLCEATFLRGQTRLTDNHLYAYEAAKIAKQANVRQLVLTHFFPEIEKNLTLSALWNRETQLTLPSPTKDEYECIGWNSKQDGTGTSYDVFDWIEFIEEVTSYL